MEETTEKIKTLAGINDDIILDWSEKEQVNRLMSKWHILQMICLRINGTYVITSYYKIDVSLVSKSLTSYKAAYFSESITNQ